MDRSATVEMLEYLKLGEGEVVRYVGQGLKPRFVSVTTSQPVVEAHGAWKKEIFIIVRGRPKADLLVDGI